LRCAATDDKIAGQLRALGIVILALCWSVASVRAAAPELPQLRLQLRAAEEAENNAAVVELSRRIVEIAPSDSETWEKLARSQFAMKDFDRCEATLDRWEKTVKPRAAIIDDLRGDLALAQKDYTNAERHWLAFVAAKPKRTDAADTYAKVADLCVKQARWRDVLEFRTRVVNLEDTAANRVARATALLRLHRWNEAYAEMKKANAQDSSDAQVKEWVPQFERLQTFLPRLKTLDAQIAKSPNDVAPLLERARVFTLSGLPLLALEDSERAMNLQPASMRARIQTAEALLDTGRGDDAARLQVSRNLLRADDKHVSEQALGELGASDALLLQNPNKADALAARSKILRELRQFTLALAEAGAALAIDNKSGAAHFEAAHDFDGLGQTKDALAHARTATELDPNDSIKWYYRGVLEAQRANFSAAIESQTRSLGIRQSLVALREREKCERRIGKVSDADADLRRMRDLSPERE
jgi:tetratricopeptide (TPR) repeat protein